MTPLRDILLDVEGTTSSVAFVHDVLFPYARAELPSFIEENRGRNDVAAELERARESQKARGRRADTTAEVVKGLLRDIDDDVKDTALKALQGMIWKGGFESGAYRAHVYPDVPRALRRWHDAGLRLSVYSSGSVEAQRLFFGHTEGGDLRPLLHAHFDTTTGPKKVASSYAAIVEALEREPPEILFLSDVVRELDAAREVGLRTCQLLREAAEPLGAHPCAGDFDEVEALFGPFSTR